MKIQDNVFNINITFTAGAIITIALVGTILISTGIIK
jgi:hypothetical protein